MEVPLPKTFRVKVCFWVNILIYFGIGRMEHEHYMEKESCLDSKDTVC